MWPVLNQGLLGELGSAETAGQLSAILFVLCGLLVAAAAPLLPAGPGVRHLPLVVVGLTAAVSGVVIGALPWARWSRRSTLWLVPPAFALIGAHNWATGGDGLRYAVFFLVVAAWVGLMHPSGTTTLVTPGMVAAYLVPGIWLGDLTELARSLTYAVPVFVLIGESASLVAERVRASESVLRRSEQRFRALVQNANDAITVIAADATILWESPGITATLGYGQDERVGTNGLSYLPDDTAADVAATLADLFDEPGGLRHLELQVRHRDGSWRWCEVVGRNLLHEPAVAGLVVNITDITERVRAQSLQLELAAIVESSTDAIMGHGLDGTIRSCNSAAERMYGYDDLVGRNVRELVIPEQARVIDDVVAQVASGEAIDRLIAQHVTRSGDTIDVSVSVSPIRDADGTVVAAASIIRDISADIRARDALVDTAASFRLLFYANPQPMWVYDATSLAFLEVNDAAIRHYGYSREQFLSMTILDIRPEDEVPELLDELKLVREERPTAQAWHHRLADGRMIDVEITSHRLDFNGREAVLVAAFDTTDRNRLEEQLRHEAFHDNLTGLSNRALFNDRVEHALGRRNLGDGAVVLLLDLDQFKLINDSQGHSVGDGLLIAVAHRLQSVVRASDTVARLGGDEFAVLLEACGADAAERQAQRLLDALSQPIQVGDTTLVATGSIGIAAAEPGMSAGELLRNADMAMYRAKSAGGGCFRLFEPGMHEDALRQLEIMAALRESIAAERFLLHYQPVVDARTGAIVAMEALVRWQHRGDLVAPAEFIPALEESGLIVPVGEWVLRRACRDASTWGDSKIQVNVNLSGRQLGDPAIVEQVRGALVASGLAPAQLVLEITESVLMHNSESVRRLTELRALGVNIAIDDFGTGYSSLSYLRTFPLDELKIDKSFIDPIVDDPSSVPLVATIVQLARSLSLATVAEGVETVEQYELLRSLGCDRVQGYYVSRPQQLADAVALLDATPSWHVPPVPPQRGDSRPLRAVR